MGDYVCNCVDGGFIFFLLIVIDCWVVYIIGRMCLCFRYFVIVVGRLVFDVGDLVFSVFLYLKCINKIRFVNYLVVGICILYF